MTANISNTDPSKKHIVSTETRSFEIQSKDMSPDGSFPHAELLGTRGGEVIASAKRKQQRRHLCRRCLHHMYDHQISYTTFLMFLFGETIPAYRFHRCSVRGCVCQGFISEVNHNKIRKEEAFVSD